MPTHGLWRVAGIGAGFAGVGGGRSHHHLQPRARIVDGAFRSRGERPEFAVLDASIAVEIGATTQPRHQLVGEDAAAIALPLVGLSIDGARQDHARVGERAELVLVEVLAHRLAVTAFGLVRFPAVAPAREHELLAAAGIDELGPKAAQHDVPGDGA